MSLKIHYPERIQGVFFFVYIHVFPPTFPSQPLFWSSPNLVMKILLELIKVKYLDSRVDRSNAQIWLAPTLKSPGGPNGPQQIQNVISLEPNVRITSNQAVNLSFYAVLRSI